MPHPIDTLEFWVEDYTPTVEELEGLYAFALEAGKPLELEVLSSELIRRRVARLTTAQAAGQAREKAASRDKNSETEQTSAPVPTRQPLKAR